MTQFHYWYPTAGYEIKACDVIEYYEGTVFADSEKTEAVYEGGVLAGISLAKNIKFVYNGSTWFVPFDSMAIGFNIGFEGSDLTQDVNFYYATPQGLIASPAAGRNKVSVDKAVGDRTYESLISHVEIIRKLLKDWYIASLGKIPGTSLPELLFITGQQRKKIQPIWHFGSQVRSLKRKRI